MQSGSLMILLEDAVEKIIRIDNFLREIEFKSSDEEKRIISFYKKQIDGLKERIEDPINEVLTGGQQVERYYNTYVDVLNYFQTLHQELLFFVSFPIVQKEIYSFIGNIFPQTRYKNIEPTTFYYYLYNFAEFNTKEYFQKLGILLDEEEIDRVVILLPYVHYKNPLMWPSLVHEMGHALEKSRSVVKKVSRELKISGGGEELELFKKWSKEIFADLLALRIMGPAYLNCFINFFLSFHPRNYTPSLTHPQPHHRVNYMYEYLKHEDLNSPSSEKYYALFQEIVKFNGASAFDLSKLPTKIKFECPSCGMKKKTTIPKLPVPLGKIIQAINKKIKDFPCIFTKTGKGEIPSLVSRLRNGVTICAERRESPVSIRDKIKKFIERTKPGENSSKRIYTLLKLMQEYPNDVIKIVNAGWEYRMENHVGMLEEIFTNKRLKLIDKFSEFSDYLEGFDYNIQKSIEVSRIHNLFC